MKISIITTCYNREDTLRDTIESVLSQDYPDIEFIIVDGASTDSSMDIVNQYRDKIAIVLSEPDRGMYEALNKGIRLATGEVIGMLHSDDLFFCNTTVSEVAQRMKETGADMLYADGIYVDKEKMNHVRRYWESGIYSSWRVRHGWLPLHTTCFIRRDVMMERGLYNEDFKIASDTDLLLRYLMPGDLKVEYLHQCVVKIRMGGLSTDGQWFQQMWNEDIRVLRANGFNPYVTKVEKMAWKVPQFVKATVFNILHRIKGERP